MTKKDENTEKQKITSKENTKYTKKQLLNSQRFSNNKDLIQVLLSDNESYSIEEVEIKIKEFKERKV